MIRRLDQLLCSQGYGSRKEIHRLVKDGLVRVNNITVLDPSGKIDTDTAAVTLNGEVINLHPYIYIMLHKPQGLLSATRDPKTPTVLSLLPEKLQKRGLFPVGRLDKDTTGLLLLTDDGAYAHRLTAPKSDIPKTYIAALSKPVTENRLDILRRPFTLPPDDGHPPIQCRAACVQLLPVGQTGTCVQVTITEGKYHEIKRMFRLIGFEVIALHRRSVGGLELDSALPPGAWRVCSAEEIAKAENR